MLKHLIISTLRSLKRNSAFTAVNVAGLSIAMLAAMTILGHVAYEYSFDEYQKSLDNVYRVSISYTDVDGAFGEHAGISNDISDRLKNEMPEVLLSTRILPLTGTMRHTIVASKNSNGPVQFSVDQIWAVDLDAFDIFTFDIVNGNRKDLDNTIQGVAMSQSMARQFFGVENPIGKPLLLNGKQEFSVSFVFDDWPENSHLHPEILVQKEYIEQQSEAPRFLHFLGGINYTYLKLSPETDLEQLQSKLDKFVARNKRKQDLEDAKLHLMPARDIHLEAGHMLEDLAVVSDQRTLKLLISLVALILAIAWFNYINLNTSLTIRRIKEIAVRRIHGAGKLELFKRQLLNTLMLVVVALGLALTLNQGFSGYLVKIIGNGSLAYLLRDSVLFTGFGLFLLLAVLVSALYPTILLNSLKNSDMIKGRLKQTDRRDGLKKTLVTTQFAITIGLLFCTLTVIYQLRHLKSIETNLEMDRVLVVKGPGVKNAEHKSYDQAITIFKNELLAVPGISDVATSSNVPGYKVNQRGAFFDPQAESSDPIYVNRIYADQNFADVYSIKLVAGRFFTNEPEIDDLYSRPLVLNESAVQSLGFKTAQKIVGQRIKYFGQPVEIIGVVKDFNMESPDMDIPSLLLFPAYDTKYFSIRLSGQSGQEVLSRIEQIFSDVYPGNPFDYFYSKMNFDKQFVSFEQFERQLSMLAILSICLASLGLLALAYDSTRSRVKEIGIRKVLGASARSILQLLLSNYVRLILLAAVISIPIVYYLLENWLNQYANRISIGLQLLLLPALGIIVLAVLMVTFQALKTVRINPVDTLRHE